MTYIWVMRILLLSIFSLSLLVINPLGTQACGSSDHHAEHEVKTEKESENPKDLSENQEEESPSDCSDHICFCVFHVSACQNGTVFSFFGAKDSKPCTIHPTEIVEDNFPSGLWRPPSI